MPPSLCFLLRKDACKPHPLRQLFLKIGNDIKYLARLDMDENGKLVAPGDLTRQMKNCYSDLEKILAHYGCTFDDVYAENVYTTDMQGFIKASVYRNSIYKKQFPTGTWLEVKGLALQGQLIEIDMEARKTKWRNLAK